MPASIKTIDTHAHYFPQSYIDLVAKHGPRVGASVVEVNGATFIQVGLNLRTGPITSTFIDLDERLKLMDAQGVGMHALSLTQPMVYWADDDLGVQLCIAYNDAISAARAGPVTVIGPRVSFALRCQDNGPWVGRPAQSVQPACEEPPDG